MNSIARELDGLWSHIHSHGWMLDAADRGGSMAAVASPEVTTKASTRPTHEQLVASCQGLVRSIALKYAGRVPRGFELDDLISYGQIGLNEAARDFDPSRGFAFTTFAYYRIRGAMLDGLGKLSGRGAESAVKDRQSHDVLSGESEVQATPQVWLAEAGVALATVEILSASRRSGLPKRLYGAQVSVPLQQAEDVPATEPLPDAVVMGEETVELLRRHLSSLPPDEASLIRDTYFEGMTLTAAGKRLGISRAWASRLHARALRRLALALRSAEPGEV